MRGTDLDPHLSNQHPFVQRGIFGGFESVRMGMGDAS